MMVAHYHAQRWNGAELARAFGVSESAVRRYLDLLTDALVLRQLPAWHQNVGKRQVKSPKVYLADPGILHARRRPRRRAPRAPRSRRWSWIASTSSMRERRRSPWATASAPWLRQDRGRSDFGKLKAHRGPPAEGGTMLPQNGSVHPVAVRSSDPRGGISEAMRS